MAGKSCYNADMKQQSARSPRKRKTPRGIPVLPVILAALLVPLLGAAAPDTSATRSGQASVSEQGPDYARDRLVGTMRAGSFSGAVFEDPSGKQAFYRCGEMFSDGTRILAVKRRHIVVESAEGRRSEYYVKGVKPGTPPGRRTFATPSRGARNPYRGRR
jgi:hypothetical protein